MFSEYLRRDYESTKNASLGLEENGALCVIVSRTGNKYCLNGTYYISDTYDFDLGDPSEILKGLSNDNMAKLHVAGLSKAFHYHGEKEISYMYYQID